MDKPELIALFAVVFTGITIAGSWFFGGFFSDLGKRASAWFVENVLVKLNRRSGEKEGRYDVEEARQAIALVDNPLLTPAQERTLNWCMQNADESTIFLFSQQREHVTRISIPNGPADEPRKDFFHLDLLTMMTAGYIDIIDEKDKNLWRFRLNMKSDAAKWWAKRPSDEEQLLIDWCRQNPSSFYYVNSYATGQTITTENQDLVFPGKYRFEDADLLEMERKEWIRILGGIGEHNKARRFRLLDKDLPTHYRQVS